MKPIKKFVAPPAVEYVDGPSGTHQKTSGGEEFLLYEDGEVALLVEDEGARWPQKIDMELLRELPL